MKKILPLIVSLSLFVFSCGPSDRDSVKQAHLANINSAIDEDISEFMTETADKAKLAVEEGKLAETRGTTDEVRAYGKLMVRDNTKILTELSVLAAAKNITLPVELSDKRQEELAELQQKKDAEFDERFIAQMTLDRRSGVDEFEDGSDLKDQDIKLFAETNLPLVKSHFDKIRALNENRTVAQQEGEEQN